MLTYLQPEISSQNEPHAGHNKVFVKDVSKVLFYMFSGMDGKSTNPYTTIKLDRESRKYIHVRLKEVTKSYNDGIESTAEKIFQINQCSEEFMSSTKYEQEFYAYNIDSNYYCVDNKEVYLQGTRDN